ncbi:MAG: zinc-ribbon domain-containing protein, partial [Clostridiales bacterium]|nr:zinc-ribbon domain-containing protein [Clostridiales bacterium]
MALIKCPECGKEISDKSSQCNHCGYPLKQLNNTICEINGIKYDLKDLY